MVALRGGHAAWAQQNKTHTTDREQSREDRMIIFYNFICEIKIYYFVLDLIYFFKY